MDDNVVKMPRPCFMCGESEPVHASLDILTCYADEPEQRYRIVADLCADCAALFLPPRSQAVEACPMGLPPENQSLCPCGAPAVVVTSQGMRCMQCVLG